MAGEDIGWRFGKAVDGNKKKIQCNFCGKVITGGITRLKQHLAHKKGDVAPCSMVSGEVRKDMMALLTGYKDKKRDKQRMDRELEEHISNSMRHVSEDTDDEEEDRELEYARRLSRNEHEFEHRRGTYASRENYHTGGSSGYNQNAPFRSYSVRDVDYARGGRQEISNPLSRLRAREIELEKDCTKKKQTKLSTTLVQKAKKKLLKAFGSWFIDTNTPFRAIESVFTNPLMETIREVGDRCRAPSAYELAEVFLPQECKEMQEYIKSHESIWDERGVTIMCDGWTGPTNLSIINFLVYSVRGTIFQKSIDATSIYKKDVSYYFKLMKDVIEEVGPHRVVQVVTDNEKAIKQAGKKIEEHFPHIYWTGCAAHGLDLLLEDLGKLENIKRVLVKAKKISQWIYNFKWVIYYMKQFTNGRELARPGITRFATQFIMLECVVRHKTSLQEMFDSADWLASRYGQMTDDLAVEVRQLLSKNPSTSVAEFWDKADNVLKLTDPIIKVLRLVDGDEKPTMGFIYEAIDRMKESIKSNVPFYLDYWKRVDKRWLFLHSDLHAAGCYLNPQYMFGKHDIRKDKELVDGLKRVIKKLASDVEVEIKARQQVYLYQQMMDSFAADSARKAITYMDPAMWWLNYGESAPELQKIAVKVLSQTTSSSNCERNWSMWSLVHTKVRNRLKYKRLHMIIYVRYNMKLKLRNLKRRGNDDINSSFDPINLDYIFEEDDPLDDWLEEREAPVFSGDDLSWLNLDDDDNDGVHGDNQQNTPAINRPQTGESSQQRQYALSPPSSDHGDDGSDDAGDDDGGDAGNDDGDHGGGYNYYEVSNPCEQHSGGFRTQPAIGEEQDHHTSKGRIRRPPARYSHDFVNDYNSPNEFSRQWMSSESQGSNVESSWGTPYSRPTDFYQEHSPYQLGSENEYGFFTDNLNPRNPENVQIYNHGTLNYGGVHYHNSTIYGGSSSSSQNEQSWMDDAGTFLFNGHQRAHYDANYENAHPEPPRRSFWY